MNHAIKSGGLVGLIGIIIGLLIYFVDPTLFVKWWFGIMIFLINLGLVIYFGLQFRNEELDGYINFKEAFIHGFTTFFVAGLIGTIFQVLLYKVIDPELPKMLSEAVVQQTYEMMKGFGAPEETIDKSIEQIKNDIPDSFTIGGMSKTFAISIIGYLILALISGAIIKKKKPEFE